MYMCERMKCLSKIVCNETLSKTNFPLGRIKVHLILSLIRWRLSFSYSDSESNKGETFSKYFEKVFFPRIVHEIVLSRRSDIVWDRYNPMSVKENTRENRDTAVGNV